MHFGIHYSIIRTNQKIIYQTILHICIGKTKRHLVTRVGEHKSDKSAIGQHLKVCHICNHSFDVNQFKIINIGKSDLDCKIKEALHIKALNPSLNQNLYQSGSSFLVNVFK